MPGGRKRNKSALPKWGRNGGEPGPTDALTSYTTEQLEDMNYAFVTALRNAILRGEESAGAATATVRVTTKRR